MLADNDAPQHAEALTQALGYAQGYAEELRRMVDSGNADQHRAARLVQATHDVILAALDSLYELDDVQQAIDARERMRELSSEELYRALSKPPTT
ncbi:hypothetical protein ABZ478_31620 [Streptomyces sp. NPDC005706]|uniref:hypothetical protein n=1 Tax=Streptomyces sp. NPDC005706 TaxID=3157169 RepID=UPI0033DD7E42